MCTKNEMKELIYNCFDRGLSVQETIDTLAIHNDRRMVNGCYNYWKRKQNEPKEKYQNVNEVYKELDKQLDERIEQMSTVFKLFKELSKIKKQDVEDMLSLTSQCDILKEILLHQLESEENSSVEVCEKLLMVQKLRRKNKLLTKINMTLQKHSIIINNVKQITENIIVEYEKMTDKNMDRFVESRKDKFDEMGKKLLEELI